MTHRAIYWVVGGLLAVLLVAMLASWNYDRETASAEAKAQQLVTAYQQAGLTVPVNPDQIARVLGDDGGAVCDAAASRQQQGYLSTRLGVGGEFYFRPTLVDQRTLQGLALIVTTYCPDKLPPVQKFIEGLHYAPVIRA
jgi:hypothetical protein